MLNLLNEKVSHKSLGDLKIDFYDHEENGKFVLEFGDMEFSTLSKQYYDMKHNVDIGHGSGSLIKIYF